MRIGVDLGGTKIEIVALDDARAELVRRRIPTPAGDYAGTVDAIARLVAGVERELGTAESVGIGIPGAPSRATGTIKNANSTVLIGKPLRADLERALGRSIRMANDANCLALSEAVDGAGAGFDVVFAAILGTGVGGGIAIGGRALEGRNAIAGEWGHNPLPWAGGDELPGPPCYCGKHGCIETFLSGPALERDYFAHAPAALRAAEIDRAARAGDPVAQAALARYEDRLARGLAAVIDLLDPDAVVLGGGVSNLDRLYANVPALLPRYVFSDVVETPILRAAHGDSSGVRGAAMLPS